MHEVLVNRLGGLSLPRKSVVRLTDRPDMTLDVYRGRKTTKQQSNSCCVIVLYVYFSILNCMRNYVLVSVMGFHKYFLIIPHRRKVDKKE